MKATEEFDILAIFQALFPQQRISQGKAVCPFHSERTASLHFFKGTDGKPRYHCFGCGVKGDVLDLIQASARLDGEELSLVQTIQRLEELTGKKLLSDKAQEAYAARNLQQERMQKVYRYFNRTLVIQPAGRKVREWLVERGIPPETWERLPIGVYPLWEEIKPWAKAEDIPYEWLKEERLLIGAEKGGERWTGAIAFFYGQAFGEISRIKLRVPRSKKTEDVRFLGRNETDIGFFGLSHYQPVNGERPLLVEGEFDMLVPWAQALRDHGKVINVFCRSGSAGKTLDSMMALKDLGMGPPILLGDNDKAGEEWGKELSHYCRQAGLDASLCVPVEYRPKEDPAELANRLGSIEAFEQAVLKGIRDPFRSQEDGVPPLPAYAQIPASIGAEACPWLDTYVEFSRRWSPRSFDLYHETCGLWLLSTIAARRTKTFLGGDVYTPLYLLLVGKTTAWKKTTATKIAMRILEQAGLNFLLAPERATPQGLIQRMKGEIPENYGDMEEESRREVQNKLSLSGRVGWYYEEFGGHLEEMLKPNGFMSEFRSLLRAFDDCPSKYSYLTRTHGEEEIKSPYLALLGALTPADFQAVERQSRVLWGDGYFARYAMIVAPEGKNPCRDRFPEGEMRIPAELLLSIREWHNRLGMPEVIMTPIRDGRRRETGKYQAAVILNGEEVLPVSQKAREAYNRYDDALNEIYGGDDEGEDLVMQATHDRLPNRALRIALLFASQAGAKEIGLSHWAKAQEIVERQRSSLHALSGQISSQGNDNNDQKTKEREDKVRRVIEKLSNPTVREVSRYAHISCREAVIVLDFLVKAGEVERGIIQNKKGRSVARFSLVSR